jgi:Fe-S-cluster containining protein
MVINRRKLGMDLNDKVASIQPIRLTEKSRFQFKCHKNVSCFTKCCRGINVILTPYDAIQLKNRLELSSEEFLAIYTEPHLLEKTDLPVISLKLVDDGKKSCPFVRDKDGCIIYEDRPTSCRYYPLGSATLQHRGDKDDDEGFFFFVHEPHCKGFEENQEWTVAKWRQDQEVDIRDKINAEWTDLMVRKRSFPINVKLTEKAKHMFFMASYNIDKFRQFVFESTFLQRYPTNVKIIEKIRNDEFELLMFGILWIKSVLFRSDAIPKKHQSHK